MENKSDECNYCDILPAVRCALSIISNFHIKLREILLSSVIMPIGKQYIKLGPDYTIQVCHSDKMLMHSDQCCHQFTIMKVKVACEGRPTKSQLPLFSLLSNLLTSTESQKLHHTRIIHSRTSREHQLSAEYNIQVDIKT